MLLKLRSQVQLHKIKLRGDFSLLSWRKDREDTVGESNHFVFLE
jgi:hypothetical protein